MPPAAADVEGMEDSNAKETLQEFPQAVGAYDRMPFASAACCVDAGHLHRHLPPALPPGALMSLYGHPQPGPACHTARIQLLLWRSPVNKLQLEKWH